MRHPTTVLLCVFAWLALAASAPAADFYVAPNGHPAGDGSEAQPWDLQTALAQPVAIRPGDTIWLAGGTYQGPFQSKLEGAAGQPILVAGIPDQRVTLNGCACSQPVLTVNGAWTWFMNFEVTTSNPDRSSDQVRGPGLWVMGPNTKFINLVVHDNNQGFSFWIPAEDSEIYGCLIFNNGWEAADRGHGHAIYTQNRLGLKEINDNIIFDQFGNGIQVYGTEDAYLDNYRIDGNIAFNNGSLSHVTGFSRNILLGGGRVSLNSLVKSNYTYYPLSQPQGDINIGYRLGVANTSVIDNYFAGGNLAVIEPHDLILAKNFLYLNVSKVHQQQFPDNQFVSQNPPQSAVFVRRNKYDANRSHIAVYNWAGAAAVALDLRGLGFELGDFYSLRSAQDYFGEAQNGIYTGGPLLIPMSGWKVAAPVGWDAAPATLPDFGAFVLTRVIPPRQSSRRR